jgi:hypothetical protein
MKAYAQLQPLFLGVAYVISLKTFHVLKVEALICLLGPQRQDVSITERESTVFSKR